ncbi:MAG: metallophosphoesterase [Clostridia bacterium]|nr:metallophosphoesterase [Clostridiales bacterium]
MKRAGKIKMGILTGLLLAVIAYIYLQNNWIQVEHVDIVMDNMPRELKGLRIAHVSDVHIPGNSPGIERILNILHREQPDIIALTGDILDRNGRLDNPDFIRFCKGMVGIAPTYAVTGNHEAPKNRQGEWEKVLRSCGVIPVEGSIEIFKKGSSRLAVMGLKDGASFSCKRFDNIEEAKGMPAILLAHRPDLFYSYCSDLNETRPDLVLSGHAHGGQFRIPFIDRGLVAPNQGFFPEYTSGLYVSDNGVRMVVSRGLGNSMFPVRLNNRTHLPVIHLQ